jgi:exodeoxyribonuclease V alpha subunit
MKILLQQAITPRADGQPERRYGGRAFRVGDKVTQQRGNYDKGSPGVLNGAAGVVTGMSLEDSKLTVLTDEAESVDYAFDELDELTRAYAATIHSRRALAAAIRTPGAGRRHTGLTHRLHSTPRIPAPGQVHEQPAQATGQRRPDRGPSLMLCVKRLAAIIL